MFSFTNWIDLCNTLKSFEELLSQSEFSIIYKTLENQVKCHYSHLILNFREGTERLITEPM